MLLNDTFTILINKDKFLEIQDNKLVDNLKVKIESSHSGIINKNDVFYTPNALREGSRTLVNPFKKSLQRKHYNKAVGPIEASYYVDTIDKDNLHYKQIENAKTPTELVDSVNKYLSSSTYKDKSRTGLGALFIEGTIFDENKIQELKDNIAGYVSIAGDSKKAYCSICASVAGTCKHKAGQTYNRRKAFYIVDSAILDHVSFEEYPADDATRTFILQDEHISSHLEITDINTIEGQSMKITLQDLKTKLSDLKSIVTDLNLKPDFSLQDSETESSYLFIEDKLLPLTTKESIYIAKKLILDLEDSEDKTFISEKIEAAYAEIVGEQSFEDLEKEVVVTAATEENANVVEGTTVIAKVDNSDVLEALAVLTAKFTEMQTQVVAIQDSTVKAGSSLLQQELKALRNDLAIKNSVIKQLTVDLKDAILNEVSIKITDADKRTEFLSKLEDKTVSEIKTALVLLDSLKDKAEPETVIEQAVEQPVTKITDAANAVVEMATKTDEELKLEDADKLLNGLLEGLQLEDSAAITKTRFSAEYKKVVAEHGFDIAKQFATKLKDKHKIK